MSHEAYASSIRSYFGTVIEDGQNVPTRYDNDGSFQEPNPPALWVDCTINFGDSVQAELGTNRVRTVGVLSIAIRIPFGKGDQQALQLADTIKAAFTGKRVGEVRFRTASAEKHGQVGSEWQVNVTCPFWADGAA